MNFVTCSLRPGKILKINEEKPWQIQLESPGLFSRSFGDDKLPWVDPWIGSINRDSYSAPKIGQEVWVLFNEENPMQIHWFPKNDHRDLMEISNEIGLDLKQDSVEILAVREDSGSYGTIYFSNGTGWIVRGSTGSIINIRNDGSIILNNPNESNRVIDICAHSISIGKEGGSDYSAVLGEELQKVLNQIVQCLETIKSAANGNAYTKNIGVAIGSFPNKIKEGIPKTLSNIVSLQ